MKYSIETNRLYLHPLTYEQLKSYLKNDGSLEKELEIEWHQREIHPELRDALQNTLLPSMEGNENYHFFTLWTMISKEYNCMIGDLCFKGEPCENGSVEIGYGIYPVFERKGYITEAVEVLCLWALNQKYVRSVRAETAVENIASQRVLQKNGFVFKGTENGFMKWQLHSDFRQMAKKHLSESNQGFAGISAPKRF
jgi:RimJ/RimL family protein N-acetyltransferase